MVRPRALAVLRLMNSSKVVGWPIGRSIRTYLQRHQNGGSAVVAGLKAGQKDRESGFYSPFRRPRLR